MCTAFEHRSLFSASPVACDSDLTEHPWCPLHPQPYIITASVAAAHASDLPGCFHVTAAELPPLHSHAVLQVIRGFRSAMATNYWRKLINPDKSPSPVLEQLCFGIAKVVVSLAVTSSPAGETSALTVLSCPAVYPRFILRNHRPDSRPTSCLLSTSRRELRLAVSRN